MWITGKKIASIDFGHRFDNGWMTADSLNKANLTVVFFRTGILLEAFDKKLLWEKRS